LEERASAISTHVSASCFENEPLTLVEKIAFLSDLNMAGGAGVQALADLAAVSEERNLRDKEALFHPGTSHEHFFLVTKGTVAARRKNPDVQRRYVYGEMVTGAAALSEEGRHWSAEGDGTARVLAVPLEAWFDLMEAHFELAHSTMAVLATQRELILERLAARAGEGGLVLT
jgi:CRP-like cAMP-binding protein